MAHQPYLHKNYLDLFLSNSNPFEVNFNGNILDSKRYSLKNDNFTSKKILFIIPITPEGLMVVISILKGVRQITFLGIETDHFSKTVFFGYLLIFIFINLLSIYNQ